MWCVGFWVARYMLVRISTYASGLKCENGREGLESLKRCYGSFTLAHISCPESIVDQGMRSRLSSYPSHVLRSAAPLAQIVELSDEGLGDRANT